MPPRLLRFAIFLVTLIAWLGGTVAADLHELTTNHQVCDEHDEIEDAPVAKDDHRDHDGRTSFRVAPAPSEHTSCPLGGAPTPARPSVRIGVRSHFTVLPVVQALALLGTAPRAPPLDYAPKNSPPPSTEMAFL